MVPVTLPFIHGFIYGFCMILRILSDYFIEKHKPLDLCNGEVLCFV